jgi:stage III sporulation protein AG
MSEKAKNNTLRVLFSELSGKRLFWILPIVGALLLLLGGLLDGKETSAAEEYDAEAYKAAVTAEVTALCRAVSGVGELSLTVTFRGKEEYVYATDLSPSGGEDYVLSSGKGLLLSVRHPTAVGVGIVCEGGDDPVVREALSRLVSSLLGVPSNRIAIVRGRP